MKRRRRIDTQTRQRRKNTKTQPRPAPPSANRFWSILKGIIIIALVALIAYASYKYLIPGLQQKLPSLHFKQNTTQVENSSTPTPQKPLPVAKAEEPAPQSQPQPSPKIHEEPFVKATQVEILNGCGQQGVAKILADKLKELKYDVVNTANYIKRGKPYFKVRKTKLIDHLDTKKSKKNCLKLAKAIGLSPKQVQSVSNANPIADITIIIGLDYKKLPIFKRKK